MDHALTEPKLATHKKEPRLWIAVLILWALGTSMAFYPTLKSSFDGSLPLALVLTVGTSWVWLAFAWLLGFHHQALFSAVAFTDRRSTLQRVQFAHNVPPIAVLYTTCNDFTENAALSCVNQDHPNHCVFILDDSSDALMQHAVDEFQRRFSAVQVLRRTKRPVSKRQPEPRT